jgi:Ca2+/Na+ antiporter
MIPPNGHTQSHTMSPNQQSHTQQSHTQLSHTQQSHTQQSRRQSQEQSPEQSSSSELRAVAERRPPESVADMVHIEDVEYEEEDYEEDILPDELIKMEPSKQQYYLKLRAISLLIRGIVVLVFFSDALVDCLAELSVRIQIPPFYVAFVLAPFAANVTEMHTSYMFACKKTSKSTRIALSSLQGSVIMNNTLVLGVLLLIMSVRKVNWAYDMFAQTIVVFVVQLISTIYTQKQVQTLFQSVCLLGMYPLSIALVLFMEWLGNVVPSRVNR